MDRYFKYLSPDAARAGLTNRTLRWSRPSRFNDIFDMAVPFSTNYDAGYVRQRAVELMWERLQNPRQKAALNPMGELLERKGSMFLPLGFEKFSEVMGGVLESTFPQMISAFERFGLDAVEHMRTIKILCLSRVHDHNQMWGIYASDHKGLVLEFTNVEGIDSPYRIAKPVTYADRPPPLLDDDGLSHYLAGNIALSSRLVDPLIYLKSTEWSYEQELRMVTGDGRCPNDEVEDIPFHPLELKAVYFGARALDLLRELEPIVIAKYPHAQRWQASQGSGFRIDFNRLNG